MRILWINMTVPPEADAQLGGIRELKNTGGWVLGLAYYLVQQPDVELAIASASPLVKENTFVEGEAIKYFIVPSSDGSRRGDALQCENWKKVYAQYRPDVVHIHGTEYRHALTWVRANGAEHTVVSLQGVLSSIWHYYYDGMSQWDVIRNITPRDIYKGSIFTEKRRFMKTSESEVVLLNELKHVIGRTRWDRIQSWAINPGLQYHFCNEVLRHEFYDADLWNYSECDRNSIFVSQGSVPYKGLHQLLKAMPLVLREFPDASITIAGFNIIDPSFKRKLMRTGYGRYIQELIDRYSLDGKVRFTGRLNAKEMIDEYLRCNVFVLPSSIENSPNSLGEAQILGVPCVAANVGGVEDMVPSPECGQTYHFNDPSELACEICDVFRSSRTHNSVRERQISLERHNPETNIRCLLDIYKSI